MIPTGCLLLLLATRAPQEIGVAQAAPPQAADSAGAYAEFYDVRDLALPARLRALLPEPGPAVIDRGAGAAADLAKLRGLGEVADADESVRANLVAWRLLTTLLQCMFSHEEPFSCEAKSSGALVVRARASTHRRVAEVLNSLRRNPPGAITVEIRRFELDAQQRDLLVELEKVTTDHPEMAVALIERVSPETIERLGRSGVIMNDAPTIATFPLEPFELRIGDDCAYVASFDLVSIEGIGRIADPVIKTIFDGLKIQGRVVAVPGMEWKETPFALRLEVESSVLKRPMAKSRSDAGEIQLPEVKHATIATTVAGTVGGAFLLGGVPKPSFDPKDEGKRIYLLVTVGAPIGTAGK